MALNSWKPMICNAVASLVVLPAIEACEPKIEGYCELNTAGLKYCPVQGVQNRVRLDDPTFGCSESTCTPCALPNQTAAICDQGACVVAGCASDYIDCDQKDDNGCEVHYGDDVNNCGACGVKCVDQVQQMPNVELSGECGGGKCIVTKCKTGFYDCNKDSDDGCESDLTDPRNCGKCGTVCSTDQSCTAGSCQ